MISIVKEQPGPDRSMTRLQDTKAQGDQPAHFSNANFHSNFLTHSLKIQYTVSPLNQINLFECISESTAHHRHPFLSHSDPTD
jgi:hypothetical protein